MKFTQLKDRSRVRIRVSSVEMSVLRKLVHAALLTMEGEDEDGLWANITTGERRAMAYWNGNPFKDWPKKRYKRPRTGGKPKTGGEASPPRKRRPHVT